MHDVKRCQTCFNLVQYCTCPRREGLQTIIDVSKEPRETWWTKAVDATTTTLTHRDMQVLFHRVEREGRRLLYAVPDLPEQDAVEDAADDTGEPGDTS